MGQSETPGYMFTSSMKISYDKRFITTAQDFVQNLTRLSGENEKEVYQLTLLLEESLVFIMDKYIDEKLKAHIDIGYQLYDDGKIMLELSDIGWPIHEDIIPEFNLNETDTVDGLWYQMVKKMADDFEFVNQLNKGWLIRVQKRIERPGFKVHTPPEPSPQSHVKPDSDDFAIRKATSYDAAALMDLAFMTYRYSNGVPEFYDVNLLKTHMEKKLYDIMVVETGERIVGALSIKYSEFDPYSAEMGSAMIHPDYRGTRALVLMLQETDRYHKENPRGIDFFVTYLVTTYPGPKGRWKRFMWDTDPCRFH